MHHASPPPVASPSPALAAFLRGIERRAFVFAEVQCGDPDRAREALALAMRAFRPVSGGIPLSGWPAAFWALLLAQPALSEGLSPEPELSGLGTGPRAALLLRLVGGLDFHHAAEVMGVSEPTYRFALQRALRQLGETGTSYAALGGLRERLHRRVKTLPEDRIADLAALRQRALSGEPEPEARATPAATDASPRRRWLWGLLVLLLAALAATWWPGLLPAPATEDAGPAPLPVEAPAPAPAPLNADTEVVTHPDYALLAEPEDARLADDLALLSWFAAGGADAVPPPAPATPAEDASDAR